MKKVALLLLLVCLTAAAQTPKDKVWSLLLANKREEARKLFDKDLKNKKEADTELLILDALIDVERGRLAFDTSFLKSFSKLPNTKYLLPALFKYNFVFGNMGTEGVDDLSFEKIDYISSVNEWATDLQSTYYKAYLDKLRHNTSSSYANMSKLAALNKWQFCGVFENLNGSGLDTEYEPELYADNNREFNANSNGMVNWYNPGITQNEGFFYFYNEKEYGNGIVYAQTFINSPDDRNVVLYYSASGGLKLFVNDTEIYANDKIEKAGINAYAISFNLKKGMNRLLLKLATDGGQDYFFASLRDDKQNAVTGLECFDTYRSYLKSTADELSAAVVEPDFETYLTGMVKAKPENILYRLLLFDAYLNNHKNDEAFNAIEPLALKYPNSTFINYRLLKYYESTGNQTQLDEINKNLHLNDEGYFYCIADKFGDQSFLEEANIAELEKQRDIAQKLATPLYSMLYDYMIATRNAEIDRSFEKIPHIISESNNNDGIILLFSGLYATLKKDKDTAIKMLENALAKRNNVQIAEALMNYYYSLNRKDDAKKVAVALTEQFPYFNAFYNSLIEMANNYKQAIDYIDVGLKNFPYSFKLMEKKGMAFNALKNTAEAQKLFRQSLHYNSGNNSLRKTLYTISKTPDEIEQVATKDVYGLIKQRRGKAMPGNYGVTMLIDEYIVSILPEGGRKAKVTYVYEVNAENGIEELKEYSINGSNLNILKAEIVKPDGSLQPGEQDYNEIVFTNLKVNDVINIQYETTSYNYGRFYKDFTIDYVLSGAYPSHQTIFGIIYPDGVTFNANVSNSNAQPHKSRLNGLNCMKWEIKDSPAILLSDDYSPQYIDRVSTVTVGSIKSWTDISNWYADLVKKNMQMDNIAIKAYNNIFPNSTQKLTEQEIAFTIYKYIQENITYSSVDFRQSGFVPQKPSKTIVTKLGDCKDVSTLFVAMAQRAGLKANLVLVQTNDNGVNGLVLPSTDFNHCIVRVFVDGKEHYLEMTNNYLPFTALPISLYKANALNISFDRAENQKAGLIQLPFTNALENKIETLSTVTVTDATRKFDNTVTISGATKSYYNELFSNAVTEEVRKKEFIDMYNKALSVNTIYEDSGIITNERFDASIQYRTRFSLSDKLQSVGSLKIMKVPFIYTPYTRDIISSETRNYDINYINYENVNTYTSTVLLNIEEGKKFTEVPQNHSYSFNGHVYKLIYEVVSPNSLKVVRTVTTPWHNITVANYAAYKKYVEDVLAAEDEIIGFK